MRRILVFIALSVFAGVFCITSCRRKTQVSVAPAESSNFPDSIGEILFSKCSAAGCHDQVSPGNGQLQMDTWAHLFNGGISGAVVVAYSTTYSPLLYYCNNGYAPGDVTIYDPHHFDPYPAPTLSDYLTLKNWIASGAPDKNGNIPFASNADTRQKIYLTNQGPETHTCSNVVAVIDAQSRQIMRYIPAGDSTDVSPHDIVVSSDGAYAYVSLFNGNEVQKIDTRTDAVISTINMSNFTLGGTSGGWSIINLSPQDTAFIVTGYLPNGVFTSVNTATMQRDPNKSLDVKNAGTSNLFSYPHGITSNATFDTFYAALQYGNEIAKFTFNPKFEPPQFISVNGLRPGFTDSTDKTSPNPHQLQMLPNHSRYFVSCQQNNMVSVIDARTDSLIAQIPVGTFPQEMAVCPSKNYLFVVCMEDFNNPIAGAHGSVYVIDYTTLQVVKILYGDFSEPHDIAVDNQDGLLFIASQNNDADGVVSHHATSCSVSAGWYTVYNLNTLQPADNKRYEVTTDPYAISARFK